MKISYNRLKELIELPESPQELDRLLTFSGLEVEHIEQIGGLPGNGKGLVVGEVLTCNPHPNADKLRVTTVNVGGEQPLHIVCGAPNVAAGQKVIVATVGTKLYPTTGEPFTISKSKIRGEVSEGMICAEDEIGLGQSHDGIMVLDPNLIPGTPAAELFNDNTDFLIEIGLTANRGDAASHYGVARDLKALLNRELKPLNITDLSKKSAQKPISVKVLNPEACQRYAGVCISGIKIASSPEWLQKFLKTIGLNPINNVVDATNYILHSYGQPLHAFDLQKIGGKAINVRVLGSETPFTTLDGTERKLPAGTLVIADENKPMCIAGVFGGQESGVSNLTTEIFLESAYFNPENIRTSTKLTGLKTDSSYRFERGTDINGVVNFLQIAADLIISLAGGEVSSVIYDEYPVKIENFEISCSRSKINRLIGLEISRETITTILKNLEIETTWQSDEQFTASVPPYRSDVTRPADIAEEILRIHGLDKLDETQPLSTNYFAIQAQPDAELLYTKVAEILVSRRYLETLNNSLSSETYAEFAPEYVNADSFIKLMNPLSPELAVMRQTLLFSALQTLSFNLNRKQRDLKTFELGKTYRLQNGKPTENWVLSLAACGNTHSETWQGKPAALKLTDLSQTLTDVLSRLGIKGYKTAPIQNNTYDYGLEYSFGRVVLATIGKVSAKTAKAFGIKENVLYAELNWQHIISQKAKTISFKPISKFPTVRRDLSLVIDNAVSYTQLEKIAFDTEKQLLTEVNAFDVYIGDKLPEGKKAYALSFSLSSDEATLTDEQIDRSLKQLMAAFEQKAGAVIRQ